MWVVMLKSPDGDIFYGEAIDREGFRYRCKNPEEAEAFVTKADAEASFDHFRLMRRLRRYQLEAVDVQTISDL
ncbi:hypothetical protein IB254_01755 [Pseudomonas sp. PDM03]|uniref:hypothetical protein n=1 Tax=Pseudomonas sp. PDM03 TaxID=2769266 RepID=UPI001780BA1F|nr:hypothetical protein [Pseudomonas sp. PDM03]MBD9585769.1 hypothetical protein [Pseudomonas sp. PDM03]